MFWPHVEDFGDMGAAIQADGRTSDSHQGGDCQRQNENERDGEQNDFTIHNELPPQIQILDF
ncbi:MAG: hypothetical protein K8L91_09615 [Anaerolineae bacterium]|nr:hypothetical protein [Anaerolineae bacterium]